MKLISTIKYYDIKSLAYRGVGLAIRFSIPLFFMLIQDLDRLGEYYVISSLIAAASIFGGFELAMYHSAKNNIDARQPDKFIVSAFLQNLTILNVILLGVWFFALYINSYDFIFCVFAAMALTLEIISFEIGRFIWNSGLSIWISRRELVKPIIFSILIFVSLFFDDEVIGLTGLKVFIVLNLVFILIESKILFQHFGESPKHFFEKLQGTITYRSLLVTAGPQFIEKQIFSYLPVLERTVMLHFVSPAFLGLYGFAFSIVSSLAHLIYLPSAVATTKIIMASQVDLATSDAYKSAIKLLVKVASSCGFVGASLFFASLFSEVIFSVELHPGFFSLVVIVVSSVAYSYSTNVAALYSHSSRFALALAGSALPIIPLVLIITTPDQLVWPNEELVLFAIFSTSVLLLSFRVVHFHLRLKNLK